ncbi:MAG: hypothetical protein U1E21_25380 [Reyranellaceae bacterium]
MRRSAGSGIEGIASKRAASPYRSGRSTAWIKTKCERNDTFVVVWFDVEKAGRVGCLHLAWSRLAALVYAGSIEIGIDAAAARELRGLSSRCASRDFHSARQ